MKLQSIEAGRGLAALMVVLRHATVIYYDQTTGHYPFYGTFMFGRAGVEFFFVLSGFIMVYVHGDDLGRSSSFGNFWWKRLRRIYPAYWVATAILGTILFFSPTHDLAEHSIGHWIFSLALLPEAHDPILDVGWSLRHEMLFYVLFSTMIVHRVAGLAIMSVWFGMVAFNLIYTYISGVTLFGGQMQQFLLRGFNIEFFFGMATATLVRRQTFQQREHRATNPNRPSDKNARLTNKTRAYPDPLRTTYPLTVLVLGAAILICNGLFESFGPLLVEWPPRILVYALASSMIIYGAALRDIAKVSSVPRPLLVLGASSYSVYLTHVTVLLIVHQVTRRVTSHPVFSTELAFTVGVLAAVLGGICFSLVIERRGWAGPWWAWTGLIDRSGKKTPSTVRR